MSTAPAHALSSPHTGDGNDLVAAEDIPVNDQDDIDSLFSEHKSSTRSISSSVLEYRQIHGRTYHSDKFTANFFFPNDDKQLKSEELCHHSLTILFDDQLFLAPLEKDKIHRVLDVAFGIVLHVAVADQALSEFADQFPNASVIGTDLSPCQPQWVPPNLCFEIDDASLEWTWNANHFDFIHMRYILGGIADWTALFKEAYRCCAPGGWVESIEYEPEFYSDDGSTELEPVLASYKEPFRDASKVLNRPLFVKELQPRAFDEAGFIEKKVVRQKVPIGPWAKDRKFAEVGRFSREAMENDLEGYTQMVCQSVQKPDDEYHLWLAGMRKAIRNPKLHSYMIMHLVYGRKPE